MSRKYKGAIGFALTSSPTEEVASPAIYFRVEDGDIQLEPVNADQPFAYTRDPLKPDDHGFDAKFSFSGGLVSMRDLGYLLYMFLGGESFDAPSSTHILSRGDAPYFQTFLDRTLDVGSGATVDTGIGCKLGNLDIKFVSKDWAKVSGDGLVCSPGTPRSPWSRSIGTDANLRPLSWKTMMAAAGGHVRLAIDASTSEGDEDTSIRSLDLSLSQDLEAVYDLGGSQAGAINEGQISISYELSRAFAGARAMNERSAWLNRSRFSLEIKHVTGTSEGTILLPYAVADGSYPGGIGAGAEEIMGTLRGRVYAEGNSLITAVIKDGLTDTYANL